MTDKEWSELWDFADKRNVLVKVLDCFEKDYETDCFAVGEIIFYKYGEIRCGCCQEILIENLTQKQMKEIIKNLLEV